MHKTNSYKTIAMLVASAAAMSVLADTVDVGWRERKEISVPDGQTVTQTDRVSVDGTGHLYKTGDGTLVLPTASIVQAAPLEIGVLGGNLTLQPGGTAPAIPQPSVVASKAALWLDARSANLVVTNGAPYRSDVHGGNELVAEWLDARATSASDERYLRASPVWWTGNGGVTLPGNGVPPSKVSAYGQQGVWFGGLVDDNGTQKASGQSLLLKSSSQATGDDNAYSTLTDIQHVFIVQAVSNWWGLVLGNYRNDTAGRRDFYSSVGGTINNAIFETGVSGRGAINTSRIFYDGVKANAFLEKISDHLGLHLFEIETTDRPGQFQAFFRDSTTDATAGLKRNGGDYLYEAVIFTNRLTEVERMQVRAWLMDKWNIPATAGATPSIRLEGGSFSFADGSASPLSFAGAGEVACDTASGAVLPRGTAVVAEPKAGDSVAVASRLAGDAVTKTAGAARTITKTGRGRLAVATLPADAGTVNVSGGVLRLAPAVAPAAVTSIMAEPPDPSFESYASNTTILAPGQGRVGISAGLSTANGWLFTKLDGNENSALMLYNHYTCTAAKFSSWPAPDGIVVLYVKGEGTQATATITPPADGIYEFSFYASGRQNWLNENYRNHLEFSIGTDEASMVKFGELVKSDSPYYRIYYRTPRLVGGTTYKLRIASLVDSGANVDGTADFDDIRLRLVPDSELDTAAIAVPNGGFEATSIRLKPYPAAANTTEGWTFVSEGTAGDGSRPSVALVEQSISAYARDYNTYSGTKTSPYTRDFDSYYDCASENVFGFAQLGLFSTGGVARTTSSFTPPAGTYRLRVDAARWSCISFNGWALANAPQLEAKVSVGGGAAASLGTVYAYSHGLQPVTFPTAFTVDGTQNVVLELRQKLQYGGALVDNVALVPVRAPGELLVNGSFEECTVPSGNAYVNAATMTGWTADNHNPGVSGYSTSAVWEKFDRDNANYGKNIADGVIRLKLRGQSEIYQTGIALGAGFHRLRFWAESRHPATCDESTWGYARNGRNPVRAFLTQGTTTNEIGWTYVDSTNFVEHAFLFRVPEAGTYTLHLQGMSSPGSNWGWAAGDASDRMSHIDAVSLMAVDAADVPETPGLEPSTEISMAPGARLELEFAGTQKLGSLRLGGHFVSGTISAETHPDYISGPGSLDVPSPATVLYVR